MGPLISRILLQPAATAFVGREAEREALDIEMAGVRSGQTRTVFVLGESGVGKTRLVAEFAATAEAAGAEVLVGRCSEGNPPAFWPWIQVIRAYVEGHGREATRLLASEGAADIARLLPGLLDEAAPPDSTGAGHGDPGHERLRLFDSLVAFLRAASRDRVMMVVLDDLHWADASSLLVLRHLMREVLDSRLMVLGTYRHLEVEAGGPLSELIGWLHRTRRSTRIRLHGLGDDDVAAMVRELSGGDPPAALVSALGSFTDGNPFFIEEFCRDLLDRGGLAGGPDGESPRIPIPEEVREVLLRRVSRLGQAARDVLTAAAVLGREFRFEDLVEVASASRETVQAALEAAETGGLVHTDAAQPGTLAFSHALVTDVLKESIAGVRRAELHRRAGCALETRQGGDPLVRAASLAHHFHEAVAVGEATRALRYAMAAGHLLASRYAYEDSVVHFDRALALARGGACDEQELFEVLLALARANSRCGDEGSARDLLFDAVAVARRLDSVEMLSRAALRSATLFPVTPTERVALLEEALAGLRRCEDADPRLLARVLSALASGLYAQPADVDRREALVDEAMSLARDSGDRRTLLHVLRASHVALWRPRHLGRRVELAREHVAVAEAAGDRVEMATARTWYVPALIESENLPEADRQIARLEGEAAETRMLVYRANALSFRAMRALTTGRFDEVEFLARRAYEMSKGYSEATASMTLWSQIYYLRREQGRLAEIEAGIRMFAAQVPQVPWDWLLLHLLAEDGRPGEARSMLVEMKERGLAAALPPDAHIVSGAAMFGTAEVAWRRRDAAAAAVVLPFLEDLDGQWVTVGLGGVCLGAATHAAGLALAAMGRVEEAVRALERAEAAHSQPGVPVLRLRTRTELGAVLLAGRDRKSRRRGIELLAQTRAEAESAGLVHLLNLIAAAGA